MQQACLVTAGRTGVLCTEKPCKTTPFIASLSVLPLHGMTTAGSETRVVTQNWVNSP